MYKFVLVVLLCFQGLALSPLRTSAQTTCDSFLFREAAIERGIDCPNLPSVADTGIVTTHAPGKRGRIRGIVDGDTLVVSFGATSERVRLFMANTPEIHPDVECYGQEATDFTASLLPIDSIAWFEPGITERDRYSRLLFYVWIERPDGIYQLLQDAIVAAGYGEVVVYPPDDRYANWLFERENQAINNDAGKWGACTEGTPAPMGITSDEASCDPAYPTVCIARSDGISDLQCSDIPYRHFEVLTPDPYRFDGDGNGIGCESP